MTTEKRLQSHVLRRELHSPKSGLAITLAVLAILALVWIGTESVLAALGRPALLLSPEAMATDIRGLTSVQPGVLVAASLTSGRRGRHVIGAGDAAAVVNDEVIGSALVRTATSAAGISPDRAVATVGRTSATVRITPNSGVALDRGAIDDAVARAAAGFALSPAVRTRVVIDKKGRIGG